jgi:hypothetical protein
MDSEEERRGGRTEKTRGSLKATIEGKSSSTLNK